MPYLSMEVGMTNQCTHKGEKKEKLVAWATDCRGEHAQGFKKLICCTGCGAVLDKQMIPAGVLK